jgi:hypothetical protein
VSKEQMTTHIENLRTSGDSYILQNLAFSGAYIPSGTDAVALSHWLTHFGNYSEGLRNEMAEWVEWLANGSSPWAAYRATMMCRLVALDKQPGTRPVGIGEIWRRLWAKTLILLVGDQATTAWQL